MRRCRNRSWATTAPGTISVMQPGEPTTRYRHRTPPESDKPEDWDGRPAGDDLTDAVCRALSHLGPRTHASALPDKGDSGWHWREALLFAVAPGVVHVVGSTDLAERVRGVLEDNAIEGWRLHELPNERTPLKQVEARLGSRVYNGLTRNGFSTIEEGAAVPDDAFRHLRNVGPKFLATVRSVASIPDSPALPINNLVAAEAVQQRRRFLNDRLHETTAERYTAFVEALAGSSMPLSALDKISEALNNEPVPPTDPTVALLLETAGEDQLLEHYRRTHRNPT